MSFMNMCWLGCVLHRCSTSVLHSNPLSTRARGQGTPELGCSSSVPHHNSSNLSPKCTMSNESKEFASIQ